MAEFVCVHSSKVKFGSQEVHYALEHRCGLCLSVNWLLLVLLALARHCLAVAAMREEI